MNDKLFCVSVRNGGGSFHPLVTKASYDVLEDGKVIVEQDSRERVVQVAICIEGEITPVGEVVSHKIETWYKLDGAKHFWTKSLDKANTLVDSVKLLLDI